MPYLVKYEDKKNYISGFKIYTMKQNFEQDIRSLRKRIIEKEFIDKQRFPRMKSLGIMVNTIGSDEWTTISFDEYRNNFTIKYINSKDCEIITKNLGIEFGNTDLFPSEKIDFFPL